MSAPQHAIFDSVSRSDSLEFWSNHGLDYRAVSDFLELDKSELSKLGGVSKKSVRFDSHIPKDLKDRLEQIANICDLVADFFNGDVNKTALWFKTLNPSLGGITPRDMIRLGRYKKLLSFVHEAHEANATGGE